MLENECRTQLVCFLCEMAEKYLAQKSENREPENKEAENGQWEKTGKIS